MKERFTRAPGKLRIRKFSKSLLALIHKYDPDLVCVSSDVSCLLSYIEINIKKLSNKNLTKFETEVQQQLLTTIIVSTGYLRNTLVKITNMFRKYWMSKGEDREHLAIIESLHNQSSNIGILECFGRRACAPIDFVRCICLCVW